MPNGTVDLDKIFCLMSKKYRIEKLWLKALAVVLSSMNPRSYHYEKEFWESHLKNIPEWKNRDSPTVSASWGLFKIAFTTAWALGLRTQPDEAMVEDLCSPVINAELGAKLLRQYLDKIHTEKLKLEFSWLDMFSVALARFKGGSYLNPSDDGKLRNQEFVDNVTAAWFGLKEKEKECDDL